MKTYSKAEIVKIANTHKQNLRDNILSSTNANGSVLGKRTSSSSPDISNSTPKPVKVRTVPLPYLNKII